MPNSLHVISILSKYCLIKPNKISKKQRKQKKQKTKLPFFIALNPFLKSFDAPKKRPEEVFWPKH